MLMTIQDSQTDPALHLVAGYLQQQEIPDYVKKGDIESSDSFRGRTGFAQPQHRRFPCHTKVACYLSHLYFHSQIDMFTDAQRRSVQESLDHHATNYGITPQTSKIASFFEVEKKLSNRELSSKVASNAAQLPIADLVGYARGIVEAEKSGDKTASVQPDVYNFMSKWAFDRQFVDLPMAVAILKRQHGKPEMFNDLHAKRRKGIWQEDTPGGKLAATPRQIYHHFPQLLEAIGKKLPMLSRDELRVKVAGFATFDEPVVELNGRWRFYEKDVLPILPKLHKLAGKPLVSDLLPTPLEDWQTNFESDPRSADILRFMQGCRIPCKILS